MYGTIFRNAQDQIGWGPMSNDLYTPDVPDPGQVGGEYLQLLSGYLRGLPMQLQAQREFGPQYAEEALNTQARIAPGAMSVYEGMMPGQSGLLSSLTRSATDQVNAGASLDPALAKVAEQSVRGSQAARGLGYGPSDALMESTAMTSLGANLRGQRQAFGEQVAGLNQAERMPVYGWMAGSSPGQVMPSGQAYDIFNTAYNARAAANIAGANNMAAVDSSY